MSTDVTLDSTATRNRLMVPAVPSTGPSSPAYRHVPGPEVGKDFGITSGTLAVGLGDTTAAGAPALELGPGPAVAALSDVRFSGGCAVECAGPDTPAATRTPTNANP